MNKVLKAIIIVYISNILLVNKVFSQVDIQDIQHQLLNEEEENINYLINSFEELEELKDNPFDINTITKEQLEMFPFLSDKIIENILYYIYKYGPMISTKELLLIEDIDRHSINLLLPYIYIKKTEKENVIPSLKNLMKYGKHELSTRIDIPLYQRKGYVMSDYEKRYLGANFYNNIRYQYRYGQKVNYGLTAEKDFGEPMFSTGNKKGYDYYSLYFIMKNIKRINTLALGNYRVNYGYGMVINMDMLFGKSSSLYTIEQKGGGIKKHSSTDEYNYLQGIALSYRLNKRVNIDVFYSYRNMDGIINNKFITSLKKDGYHRLNKEFEKKNRLANNVIGTNLNYDGKYCEFGLTAVYNVFNKVLNPELKYYNKYYPRGNKFYNIGAYYKLFYKRFMLSGECAIDKNGALALINMFSYSPNYKRRFVVMNRFYDAKYQSIYANSIGEGTSVQNESAIYIGLEQNILDNLKCSGYIDYFYFPNKLYLVEKYGTSGFDFTLQTVYSPINKLTLLIRYRHKQKDKNYKEEDNKYVLPYIQRRGKLQMNYAINKILSTTTILEGSMMNYKGKSSSKGIILSQSINCRFSTIPVEFYFHGAYFNTDSYESRISVYEKGVKYAFSIPSFYYKGMRGALNIKYSPFRNIIIYGKFSTTYYSNQESIGTSLDMIQGNVKSDVNLMLCYKF